VVVEHDEDTIRRADHIIDIGPGAGKRGGTLVAEGTVADLSAPDSQTGRYLLHPCSTRCRPRPRGAESEAGPRIDPWLRTAPTLHNLQNVDVACRCSAWWR
jgi:excinuclease ABC subunit A